MMHSGEQTRIRSAAASNLLSRHTAVMLRQTQRGYQLTSEGEETPVECQSWPQARRVLQRMGVPTHKIDEIGSKLQPGTEVVVRRRI